MSTYYLDASAAVKYYILEPGSLWVRKLVDAPDAFDEFYIHTVLLSDPSIVECAAAFSVLHRVQRITRRTRDRAFEAFTKHVASGRYGLIAVGLATDNPFDHVSSLDTPQVSPSR